MFRFTRTVEKLDGHGALDRESGEIPAGSLVGLKLKVDVPADGGGKAPVGPVQRPLGSVAPKYVDKSYKFGSLSQSVMLVYVPVLGTEATFTLKVGLVTEAGQPVASNKLTTEYVVLVPGVKVIGPEPFV